MSILKLSNFRKFAGPLITRRGTDYWNSGRVEVLYSDESNYLATVHGTEDYTVKIELDGEDVISHSCNCPYSGMLCKHEVALLLEIKETLKPENKIELKLKPAAPDLPVFEINNAELTERELFVLCLLAVGDDISLSRLSYVPVKVGRGLKVSAAERAGILNKLCEVGVVERQTRYWGEEKYSVKADFCHVIFKELVENHNPWLQYFKSLIHIDRRPSYLLEVVEVILGKRKRIEYDWKYYDFAKEDNLYVRTVIKQLLLQEDKNVMLSIVKPGELLYLIHLLIDDALDYGRPETLGTLAGYFDCPKQWDEEWHICYQHLRMSTFLATGVLMPLYESPKQASYFFYTDAVIALYENRLDDSIKAFQHGLSIRKDKKVWKYVPVDTAVFFLYVIALGRRRAPKDLETLRKILEFRNMNETGWSGPVFTLANFFQSSKQIRQTSLILTWLNSKSQANTSPQVIAAIILAFFKSEELYSGEWPTPCLAVLQCEMSAFGLCDRGAWPYEPALVQYVSLETWKLELQELIDDVAGSSGASSSNAGASSRLAYVVNYSGDRILDIREQGKLKSGVWSKGKKLSYKRYSEADVEMDEIDRSIHSVWSADPATRQHNDYLPSVSLVIPYLIGTDKLMRDGYCGSEFLRLREEQPFLYTERVGDKIVFGSNMPENPVQLESGVLDTGNAKEWVYYPIPQKSSEALKRLIELKQVPAEAEPMLESLFKALKGKLEVHSEIDGAVELQRVPGQLCMSLRLTPESGTFRAKLHLCPLPGGSRSVFPGVGPDVLFDSNGDGRFEVTRSLKKEKAKLKELNNLLSGLIGGLSFTPSLAEIVLDLTELLGVLELLREHEDLFALEWPEGQPFKVLEPDTSKWEISAKSVGGWFELEGEIALTDNHIVSVAQLLSMARETTGGYIRLGEDEYLRLSDSLRRQLNRIDAVSQGQGSKLRVNRIAMAVGGSDLQGELEIVEPESLVRMRQRMRESETLEVEIPQELNATLRDYQEDGVRWMLRMASWGAGVCLADDMGLGKTLQTLACMLSRKDKGAQMVVAPASVVGNWRREANRFAPSLNVVMLNELAMNARGDTIASLGAGDLLVLTYGLLVSECEALAAREWASVCLDEAHTIKNRDTKSSAAAMRLKSDCRIILTGTPIQNHLGELWNLMQFINPGLLGSYDHFNDRFIGPISSGQQDANAQLKKLISPFLLRRTKQQVARELPDKEEIILPVSLSDEEMSVYEVIRREAKSELESSAVVNVNALAMITKLREAACSAALIEKGLNVPSSKLSLMVDKLQQIVEQGNKVLVFSQFTSFLDMARKELEASGITDYYYLSGSTPVRERQKMVEAFQSGEKRVFLISLKAGGLGLNLTGANYVIHLDPWWNPAIEQQATDRAYRIGQKQKVTVYHLISEHTIEEKILRLHQTKRSLADSLLQGSDMSHKLTAKDLLEMIA